jgi:hypothetical protein
MVAAPVTVSTDTLGGAGSDTVGPVHASPGGPLPLVPSALVTAKEKLYPVLTVREYTCTTVSHEVT